VVTWDLDAASVSTASEQRRPDGSVWSAEMDNVPDEMLLTIFELMPVADLCRCERYVSWYFVLVCVSFSIYFSFPLTSLFVLFLACGKENHLATSHYRWILHTTRAWVDGTVALQTNDRD